MAAAYSIQVSREGRRLIIIAMIAAVVAFVVAGIAAAIPLLVAGAVLVYLFRDPERVVPALPLAVVSPIDGKVISVGQADDPYLERKVQRIVIRMHLAGVYSTRSPIEGKVMQGWFKSVRPVPNDAAADKLHEALTTSGRTLLPRDRVALWLQTDEADNVVLSVIPHRFGFAPRCYVHVGQRVGQGQRCGFIPFGARIEVLLPESARLSVSAGDQVTAGSAVIATLVHQAAVADTANQETEKDVKGINAA